MKPNELFNYLKSIKHEEYITAGDDVQYLVRTFHDEKRIRLMFEESCGKTDWKNNFNFPIKPYKCQENVVITGRNFAKKTQKYAFFIKKNDYKGMKVEINCTGSDTTIIASEKLNRTAYVMELDPHYCDVIRRRWTQWAAENAVDAGSGALD